MCIRGRGEGEVAFVDFRVASLLQRPQHQVRQDAFFRLAGNLFGQLLIHARRDLDFLRDLNGLGALAAAIALAPFGLELHAFYWQWTDSERVAELRRDVLEIVDSLGIGLFVDAV